MTKVIKFLLILVFLVAVGGFFYFKTTPGYSLVKLAKAYKTHDIELAKQYIDIDGVASQAADEAVDLFQEEMSKPSASTNEWERMGEEFGKMLIQGFLPKLKETVKEEITKSFTEGIEGIDEGKAAKTPAFQFLSLRDLIPGGKISIRQEGVIRLVTIPNDKGEKLTFRMKKEGGNWRIVKWEDFKKMAQELIKENTSSDNNQSSKNAKYGDRIDLSNGWFLTVNEPEQYNPSNYYDQPEKENKLVSVEVVYENTSNKEGSYDASNFELKDNENHRYKREYSGRKPELDSSVLPPGEKVKGFITYEVLENSEIARVIYSSSGGGTVVFGGSE